MPPAIAERTRLALKAAPGQRVTQMHFARKGVVTEEMEYVALREKLEPELVRSEVARGRMVIPVNVNHPNLEPMCIGIVSSLLQGEREHRQQARSRATPRGGAREAPEGYSIKYGADTVMDLSTGGDIDGIPARRSSRSSPVPIGTVPIYQALQIDEGLTKHLTAGRSPSTCSSTRRSRASTTSPSTRACSWSTCRS